jgi:hypothetical protein
MTFERLRSLAEQGGLDFDALRAKTRCCTACRMCEPYIRRMLLTGETTFSLDRKNPAPVGGHMLGEGLTPLTTSGTKPDAPAPRD